MKKIKEVLIVIPSLSRNLAKRFTRFLKSVIRNPKSIAIGILGLLLATVGIIYFTSNTKGASAAWFDDSYKYRKKVTISNSGSAQTDFQVSFTLDTATPIAAGKMQGDCDDIRITRENGELLPHWIEEGSAPCNNASTKIWVKIPSIPVSDTNIYVYYGNPSATAGADGSKVFPFFDDFNGGVLDVAKWTATGANSFSGGAITITTGSIYANNTILPDARDYMFEYRTQWAATNASYAGMMIADAQSTQGGNAGSNKLMYTMTGNNNLIVGGWAADGLAASYNIVAGTALYTATAATYYIDGFSMDSSNVRYYNNRSVVHTASGSFSTPPYMYLGYFIGSAAGTTDIRDMTTDWVLARKFAATAPSAGSPGSEETTPGPIAYWKFDEGQGSTAYDSTQGANNGTLGSGSSAPTWQTEDMCISGKCLYFDGTNDVMTVSNTVADIKSVSFWLRLPSTSTTEQLLDLNGTDYLTSVSGVITANGFGTETIYIDGRAATTITANQWHHVTVTTSSSLSGSAVKIGQISTNFGQAFIDEVKFYPYARTAAEIKQEFAARGSVHGVSAQFGDDDLSRKLSSGLVGYWKMDEVGVSGSNWTAIDSSGNGNNGTGAGNASVGTTAPGKFGNAGFFDGNGDYVNSGDINSSEGIDSVSLSVWIKTGTDQVNKGIIGKWSTGNSWVLRTEASNTLACNVNTGTSAQASYSVDYSDNSWHHIVCVYDGTHVKMYYDGAAGSPTSASGTITTTTENVLIGSYSGTYFTGSIDDVRVYSRALDPSEVKALYQWAPGPVAYYDMNENTGTTAKDTSGSGNNGNLGAGSSAPSWVPGKFGSALNFDGNDYLDVGVTNLPTGAGARTISAWIKQNSTATRYYVAGYGANSANQEFRLVLNVFVPGEFGIDVWGSAWISTASLQANRWYYLAVTYAGSGTPTFYVDGVAYSATTVGSPSVNTSASGGKIGIRGDGTYPFKGLIDQVRIYNYARTQKQIIQDMNAGHPSVGTPVGSPVGYWKLDEGYGGTANNSGNVGSTANGTLGTGTSAPSWTNDGKFAKALSFDGTGDYVSMGSNSALSADSMSYSVWYKTDSATNPTDARGILHRDPNTGFSREITISLTATDGYLQAIFGNGVDQTAVVTVLEDLYDATWHHAVVIKEYGSGGDYVQLYVDGKLRDEKQLAFNVVQNTTTNFELGRVGATSQSDRYFSGIIDEVKLYNFALTADEVKVEYNRGKAIVLGAGSTGVGNTSANSASREYCPPGDTATCNAPVMEWKFDENAGSTANDTSGNANAGTLRNMEDSDWSPGKSAGALNFDGSNEYVAGTNASNLQLTDGTMEAWIKTSGAGSSYRGIVVKQLAYGMFLRDNVFVIYDWTASTFRTTGISLNDGKWHHVAVTFDSGTTDGTQLYIDGILKLNTLMTVSAQTDSMVVASGSSGGSQYFAGSIDNAVVYDYERTPAQIMWSYNKGAPVAHYKLDECEGTTIYNSVRTFNDAPAGNNGTLYLGSSGTTSAGTCTTSGAWFNGATGKRNASLDFDGSDDYIDIGSTASALGSEGSITAWIKLTDTISSNTILASADEALTTYYFHFRVSLDKLQIAQRNNDTEDQLTGSTSLSSGTWHHVALVSDGSAYTMYINGKPEVLTITGGSNTGDWFADTSNRDNMHLGVLERTSKLYFFKGQLDDVKVFNYGLTAAQIKTEMNSGAVRFE